MRRAQIAICSIAGDMHALAIHEALRAAGDVSTHLVETDRLSGMPTFTWWGAPDEEAPCILPSGSGTPLAVGDLDLVWWRRIEFPQHLPPHLTDPAHRDLVYNDCNAALLGMLLTEFGGAWISHPTATRVAANKLVQLRAAHRVGLRVPQTLISQDPAAIRRFCARLDGRVVIKPVHGTHLAHLFTQPVTEELLDSEAALQLAPAIYQERIPGSRHLRVQCFGNDVYAAQLESADLDWRGNLDIPWKVVELDADLTERLRAVLRLLDLRMGIFDLKLTDDGEVVWLEVNPQGQFLFVEGLTGQDLTAAFAAFLRREAVQAAGQRAR
jgi:glutathione synthase/RimK-type ligase-like ATP-grasp enzyme